MRSYSTEKAEDSNEIAFESIDLEICFTSN